MLGIDVHNHRQPPKSEIPYDVFHFQNEVSSPQNKSQALADLNSEVKRISESLFHCYRTSTIFNGKNIKETKKTTPLLRPRPETFGCSLRKGETQHSSDKSDENFGSSFLGANKGKLEESPSFSGLEVTNGVDLKDSLIPEEFHKADDKPEVESGDAEALIELIQRELEALGALDPSVWALVSALREQVLHYKECGKCSKKFSSSLSLVLNRIRELNCYVVTKRRRTHRPSFTLDPLRPKQSLGETEKKPLQVPEKKVETSRKRSQTGEKSERALLKSEKVDPIATAEGVPGVQLVLFVLPEEQTRQVLEQRVEISSPFEDRRLDSSASGLSYGALAQVVKFQPKPQWEKKQEITAPREISPGACLVFKHCLWTALPLLVFTPEDQVHVIRRRETELSASQTAFQKYRRCLGGRTSFCFRKIVTESLSSINEVREEEREEVMEFGKVRKEVNSLKETMAEVNRNQLKLSNVLLEEGIFSQALVKLTDPNLLKTESEVVRRVEEIEGNFAGASPGEALQSLLQELRYKCDLKNRLILILLKGLHSNAPREWWEEIVSYAVDEAKPLEEFDCERIDGFIQQLSFFLAQDPKASGLLPPPPPPRAEEELQEEEPHTKENPRASTEEDAREVKTSSTGNERIQESVMRLTLASPESGPKAVTLPLKKLENQISLLNMENENLWREVYHLRKLLKTSIKQSNERRMLRSASVHGSLIEASKPSGKTINLTIQIASDVASRRFRGSESLKMYSEDGQDRTPRAHSAGSCGMREFSSNLKNIESKERKSGLLESRPKFHVKPERRFSHNDLSFLDDFSQTISNDRKLRVLPSERTFEESTSVLITTPRSSERDVFHFLKSSENSYPKPSMLDAEDSQAGPSRKNIDYDLILQKPSLMKLVESQSVNASTGSNERERELEPILENEDADLHSSSCPSGALCYAVRQLRNRIRAIHKEVAMLKLRNDRVDKVLDKLVDDTVRNNKCFEEVENNYRSFNQRLGGMQKGETEVQPRSDSEGDSEYRTGPEDVEDSKELVDPTPRRTDEWSPAYDLDSNNVSSFVGDLLSEDYLVGGAVVDMFVAVKAVNETLGFLAMCNNELMEKLNVLNKEGEIFKQEYRRLLESMEGFLTKMKEDEELWESLPSEMKLLSFEDSNERENGEDKPPQKTLKELREKTPQKQPSLPSCSEYESAGTEDSWGDESQRSGSLASSFREKSFSQAMLVSLLASLMWLQRRRRSPAVDRETKTGKESRLSSSTVQMISDIYRVATSASLEADEDSRSLKPIKDDSSWMSSLSIDSEVYETTADSESTQEGESAKMADDATSEEAEFEEASSDLSPLPTFCSTSVGRKPRITCMGDVTKEAAMRQTESNARVNPLPSWIKQLSSEIGSKLKKKRRHFSDRSHGRSGKVPTKFTDSEPLAVRKNDEFLYKKRGLLKEIKSMESPVQTQYSDPILASDLRNHGRKKWVHPVPDERKTQHRKTKEKRFRLDGTFDAGTGEAGGRKTLAPRQTKDNLDLLASLLSNPSVTKARLNPLELKSGKASFFHIERCIPVYFGQTFVRKTPRRRPTIEEGTNESLTFSYPGDTDRLPIVIEDSDSDLVIHVQLDLGSYSNSDFPLNTPFRISDRTFGTQTVEIVQERNQEGEYPYYIWKVRDAKMKEQDSEEPLVVIGMSEDSIDEEEKVVMVREPKEKTVTFNERLLRVYDEGESLKIAQATADIVHLKHAKHQVDVWYVQRNMTLLLREERRSGRWTKVAELENALKLIHEIENDIVDVKPDRAISILPRLELELRKHLQWKLKVLEEPKEFERESSLHDFFSATDLRPQEEEESAEKDSNESSEARLNNVLLMLSNLEEAVRMDESSSNSLGPCEHNTLKIYKLLQALTLSIREVEESPNVKSLSQTLEIASQLDTAVREYDGVVTKQPSDFLTPEKEIGKTKRKKEQDARDDTTKKHMKSVRKRVFEIVQDEAVNVEGRIQKGFERMDNLAKDNDEALTFLETFLQKTERRVSELESLKENLKGLSSSIKELYENSRKNEMMWEKVKNEQEKKPEEPRPPQNAGSSPVEEEKAKPKEKNEAYQKILDAPSNDPEPLPGPACAIAGGEELRASIKELKQVGDKSLYLSWTKPEGPLVDSIIGYQIYVNEKLHHKVRNPKRLQAVLYSVEPTEKTVIGLFAVTEKFPKVLLATIGDGTEEDDRHIFN